MYRSTVCALQYVTLTQPDIAFCVNKACQYMSDPHESHWSVVKRMIRYLSGTITHGLLLTLTTFVHKFSLQAYCDSEWVSDPDDKCSTSGSSIYLEQNLVAWSFKK